MRGVLPSFVLLMISAGIVSAYVGEAAPPSNEQYMVHHGLFSHTDDDSANRIVNDILIRGRQLSASSVFTRSCPKCWTASISTISRWKSYSENGRDQGGYWKHAPLSGSSYCASLTSEEQEVLALELTNCQLLKENRSLFTNVMKITGGGGDRHRHPCPVGMGDVDSYEASACLPLMSEYSLNLYHQVLLHTNEVCNRLTEEMMILRKEEIAQMLVHASSAVSHQMWNVLEEAASAVEKMQEQSALIDDQSVVMREQWEDLQRMSVARRREEQEAFTTARKQAVLLEEQLSLMEAQKLESAHLHRERDRAMAEAMDRMANRTASFLKEHGEKLKVQQDHFQVVLQAREKESAMAGEKMKIEMTTLIAEQADMINEQKRDLELMQEMISNANSQMQPLSTIESSVRLATGGFALVKALLNFFLSMNVSLVITAMPLLGGARRYLFAIFSLGILAEIAVVFFADNALIKDVDGLAVIEVVRDWTRASAVLALVVSSLIPCFSPPKDEVRTIVMDDLLKNQMDLVAKLNASTPVEMIVEGSEAPIKVANHHKSTPVRFRGDRDRSKERARPENTLIALTGDSRPRRKSRCPHWSSLTELAMPVITPIQPRAKTNDTVASAALRPHLDNQSPYYVHQSDAIMREEKKASLPMPACARVLQKRLFGEGCGEEETFGASNLSDESTVEFQSVSTKRNKKRKISVMYATSSDKLHFVSANNKDRSMLSTTPNKDISPSGVQETKKCKLAEDCTHELGV